MGADRNMQELKELIIPDLKETTIALKEHREKTQEIRLWEDIDKIKSFWANGIMDAATIKKKLNLNSKQYTNRLDKIAQEEVEHKSLTWLMFLHKKQLRYQQCRDLLGRAKETKHKLAELGCLRLMNEMDNDIIEIGQRLGMVYSDPNQGVSLEGMAKKWMEMIGMAQSNGGKSYMITNESLSVIPAVSGS